MSYVLSTFIHSPAEKTEVFTETQSGSPSETRPMTLNPTIIKQTKSEKVKLYFQT